MCLPFFDLDKRTLAKGEHAGFAWEIVKNHLGYRCGYVRVLAGHPWFGNVPDADVHGGLTFADKGKACATHDEEAEWWIGFDCAHAGDAPDPALIEASGYRMPSFGDEEIRSQEYVEAECRALCEQAAAVA